MPTVVCSLPESRFEKYGVSWPDGWDVRYIGRPISEEGLKEIQDALIRLSGECLSGPLPA
jgi:hypothetical protein